MSPEALIEAARRRFEADLAALVARTYSDSAPLGPAVCYVMQAGGKRVRPLLCLLTAEAFGGAWEDALPAAAALEFVHTYSLVHDDLPCLDNDDWRRGRQTAHKVFGEDVALLAGDALLTDAFALLVAGLADRPHAGMAMASMTRELAAAAGGQGMVLGQSLDVHWTGRGGATQGTLDRIHALKTGRLIGASLVLGAIAAGANSAVQSTLRLAGEEVGLAFQILDDLLDESGATGKSQGKDVAAGKLTYLAMMEPAQAWSRAEALTAAALGRFRDLGLAAHSPISALVAQLLHRQR